MLNVVCVRVGDKYPFDHVVKLKNMVKRHLPVKHRFYCLTDLAMRCIDIWCIDISKYGLKGWWAKMNLFNRELLPSGPILYFDLDTVIVGDLTPLAEYSGDFAICANFTRAAGHTSWPCKYGSCVMSIPDGFGQDIWDQFIAERERFIKQCPRGDQEAIEKIYPFARYLQDEMPPGFFLGYRDLTTEQPKETAVVVFGGNNKPENCQIRWAWEAWR